MGKYRKYTPETKVRIVLEILRGEKSLAQVSRDYQIKDSLLYRWKGEFLEGAKQAFAYGQAAEQKRRADVPVEKPGALEKAIRKVIRDQIRKAKYELITLRELAEWIGEAPNTPKAALEARIRGLVKYQNRRRV